MTTLSDLKEKLGVYLNGNHFYHETLVRNDYQYYFRGNNEVDRLSPSQVISKLIDNGYTFTQDDFDNFIKRIVIKRNSSWIVHNYEERYLKNSKFIREIKEARCKVINKMFGTFTLTDKQLSSILRCFPENTTINADFIDGMIKNKSLLNLDTLIKVIRIISHDQIDNISKRIKFSYNQIIYILKNINDEEKNNRRLVSNISYILKTNKVNIDLYFLDHYTEYNPEIKDLIEVLHFNNYSIISNETIDYIIKGMKSYLMNIPPHTNSENNNLEVSEIKEKLNKIIINCFDNIEIDTDLIISFLDIGINSPELINHINNPSIDIDRIVQKIMDGNNTNLLVYLIFNNIVNINADSLNSLLKNDYNIKIDNDHDIELFKNLKEKYPDGLVIYDIFKEKKIQPNNETLNIACNNNYSYIIDDIINNYDITPTANNLNNILLKSDIVRKTYNYVINNLTAQFDDKIIELNETITKFLDKKCDINDDFLIRYYDMMHDDLNDIDFLCNIIEKYHPDYNLKGLYDYILSKIAPDSIINSYNQTNHYYYGYRNNDRQLQIQKKNKLIEWNNNRRRDVILLMKNGTKSIHHVNMIYKNCNSVRNDFSKDPNINIKDFIVNNLIPNTETLMTAIEKFDFEFINELFKMHNYTPNKSDLDACISFVTTEILVKILNYKIIPDHNTFRNLIKSKNLFPNSTEYKTVSEKLKILKRYGLKISKECIIPIICNRNINSSIFQLLNVVLDEELYYYFHFFEYPINSNKANIKFDIDEEILYLRDAFRSPNYSFDELMAYMKINNLKIDRYCFDSAVRGNMEVYNKLIELGCEPPLISLKSIGGNSYNYDQCMPMIKYLIDNYGQNYEFMSEPYDLDYQKLYGEINEDDYEDDDQEVIEDSIHEDKVKDNIDEESDIEEYYSDEI